MYIIYPNLYKLIQTTLKNSSKKIIYCNNMRGIQAHPRAEKYFKYFKLVNTFNTYKKRKMKIPQKIEKKNLYKMSRSNSAAKIKRKNWKSLIFVQLSKKSATNQGNLYVCKYLIKKNEKLPSPSLGNFTSGLGKPQKKIANLKKDLVKIIVYRKNKPIFVKWKPKLLYGSNESLNLYMGQAKEANQPKPNTSVPNRRGWSWVRNLQHSVKKHKNV